MITGKQLAAGKQAALNVILKIAEEDVWPEREQQNLKFTGHILGVQHHNAVFWSAILGEESGEATQAALDLMFEKDLQTNVHARLSHLRAELVQTAAVAFAIIERIDVLDPALLQAEGSYVQAQT